MKKKDEIKEFIESNKLEWHYNRYMDSVLLIIPYSLMENWNTIVEDFWNNYNRGKRDFVYSLNMKSLTFHTKEILDHFQISPEEIFGENYEDNTIYKKNL